MGGSQLWGTIGTWAVGILAFVIAILQYLNTFFRPRVEAVFGPIAPGQAHSRFVVAVRNKGGATGMVARVGVVHDPDHKYEAKVDYPEWPADRPPFPFLLSGHSAAIVVIDLAEQIRPSARILVSYDGKRVSCARFQVTESVLIKNRTALPPDSLAILRPPTSAVVSDMRLRRARAARMKVSLSARRRRK